MTDDPTVAPPSTSKSGSRGQILAGRYELIEKLGEGGMGTAYRAHDRELKEDVVLKLVRTDDNERFKREIKTQRQVTHRNVVRIYDFGVDGDDVFISMEYLAGGTLSHRIPEGGLAWEEALPLAAEIADGLGAAHELGIIHRDVKPDNVIFGSDDVPKIGDFGIAREADGTSVTMGMVGTPHYMSPEQVEQGGLTTATDVYGFGILLYQLFTGRLPFEGDAVFKIAKAHVADAVPPPTLHRPDLPTPIEDVILRCLSKNPDDRYANAGEVAHVLRHIMDSMWRDAVDRLRRRRGTARMHILGRALGSSVARWGLALFAAGSLGAFALTGQVGEFEMNAFDGMVRQMALSEPLHEDVVPVRIDNQTMEIYSSTIRRDLLPRLESLGASVIVGDLTWFYWDSGIEASLPGVSMVLGYAHAAPAEVNEPREDTLRAFQGFLETLPVAPTSDNVSIELVGGLVLPPVSVMEKVDLGVGNVARSDDGITRSGLVIARYRDRYVPSLALVAAARYLGVQERDIRVERGVVRLPRATFKDQPPQDLVVPLDTRGNIWMNFFFPDRALAESFSARHVLDDDAARLDGKVVVVFEDHAGLPTTVATARAPKYPAGMVHAQTLSALLTGRYIRRLPRRYTLALVLLAILVFPALLANRRIVTILGAGLLVVVFSVALGGILLAAVGTYMEHIVIAIAGVWTAVLYGLRRYLVSSIRSRV